MLHFQRLLAVGRCPQCGSTTFHGRVLPAKNWQLRKPGIRNADCPSATVQIALNGEIYLLCDNLGRFFHKGTSDQFYAALPQDGKAGSICHLACYHQSTVEFCGIDDFSSGLLVLAVLRKIISVFVVKLDVGNFKVFKELAGASFCIKIFDC